MKMILALLTVVSACSAFAQQNNLQGNIQGGGLPIFYENVRETVVCSSNRYDTVTCPLRGELIGGFLTHQISRSACTLNSTYFIQGNSIVVSNGCRAQFTVDLRVQRAPIARSQTVQCSSNRRDYVTCNLGVYAANVVLIKQDSKTACILNSTYGVVGNAMWVDKGCRGVFNVTTLQ